MPLMRIVLGALLLPLLVLLLALFGIAWLSEALKDIGGNHSQPQVVSAQDRAAVWRARAD